jgi:hypothetical protein
VITDAKIQQLEGAQRRAVSIPAMGPAKVDPAKVVSMGSGWL